MDPSPKAASALYQTHLSIRLTKGKSHPNWNPDTAFPSTRSE
jgi:hypothetical protein